MQPSPGNHLQQQIGPGGNGQMVHAAMWVKKKARWGNQRAFINVGSDLLSRLRTTIGPNALASEFGKVSGVSRWV